MVTDKRDDFELGDDLIDTAEAAPLIHRSPETMIRWRRLRQGPPFLRVGRKILYSRRQLKRWIAEQSSQAGAA